MEKKKFSRKIARFIVEKRIEKSIETTGELVEIIRKAIPAKFQREGHPAKRTFQAIRIEVNKELQILNKAIEDSVNRLNEDGRLSIITFHSLEDRIVKVKFKELEKPCTCPPSFPICVCGKKPQIKNNNKKNQWNPQRKKKKLTLEVEVQNLEYVEEFKYINLMLLKIFISNTLKI